MKYLDIFALDKYLLALFKRRNNQQQIFKFTINN